MLQKDRFITKPVVSIIIPCYNYGRFLSETLESVLKQTYENWECIIIDDGSNDNTGEIALKYKNKDTRFKYIHQCNEGTSPAKNKGLQHATGTLIHFLDADDLIAPKKLELNVEFLLDNPLVDLIYGNAKYFETNKPTKYYRGLDLSDNIWMPCVSGKDEHILKHLMVFNIMVISAPLIRRNLINHTGFFNIGLRGFEDWEFWIRCALNKGYFKYDDSSEVLTFIRVHPSNAQKNELMMVENEIKLRKLLNQHNALSTDLKKINYPLYLQVKKRRAYKLIKSGKWKNGFSEIVGLLKLKKGAWFLCRNSFMWIKNNIKV